MGNHASTATQLLVSPPLSEYRNDHDPDQLDVQHDNRHNQHNDQRYSNRDENEEELVVDEEEASQVRQGASWNAESTTMSLASESMKEATISTTASLEKIKHESFDDFLEVQTAWRTFLQSSTQTLTLGARIALRGFQFLVPRIQQLPINERPIRLLLWDNGGCIAGDDDCNDNDNDNFNDTEYTKILEEWLEGCQDSVQYVELHGFGGPLSTKAWWLRWSSTIAWHRLASVRLYNWKLQGTAVGHQLHQSLFQQNLAHLYFAHCDLDDAFFQALFESSSRLPVSLHLLDIYHCQLTDEWLQRLLHQVADARVRAREQEPLLPLIRPMDLCLHGNDLTVQAIGWLAHYLKQHPDDLIRRVTLHANPRLDAHLLEHETSTSTENNSGGRTLLQHGDNDDGGDNNEINEAQPPHSTQGAQQPDALDQFLHLIHTQVTSLRHFSWHQCRTHCPACAHFAQDNEERREPVWTRQLAQDWPAGYWPFLWRQCPPTAMYQSLARVVVSSSILLFSSRR